MRFQCFGSFAITFAALLFLPSWTAAQSPLEPSRMPPHTSAYLIWRGTPASDIRKSNSLLALWDDPDFAPVRSALFENLMQASEKEPTKRSLSREDAELYSTLLENAFVFGYIPQPQAKSAASAATAPASSHSWNGFFLVYNRAGKEALLAKAVTHIRSSESVPPHLSQLTIAGIPALKVERKDNATYWVEHGSYAASAGEPSVLEEILPRLESPAPPATSLAQSAAYQEAQPLLSKGLVEFFVQIPNLKTLAGDATASGFKLAPLVNAIKLESVHSFSGQLTLQGSRTRVQAALLGDATPGTLFDLWSDGQSSPASLALLPPNAVSYSETQLDLSAFYQFLKRVVASVLPQGQQGNADMLDTLAQQRLGMPLTDALGLLSGEFASMQTSATVDPQKAVYVAGIRKKPEAIRLLRSIFGDQVTSERTEGDVTFLKISLGGGQGTAGVAQWNFYHVAVTPEFLLASSRIETLKELLASRSPASGLAARPQWQTARAGYPDKLDGIYYFDFQKVDWPAMKNYWLEEARKASAQKSLAGSQKNPAAGSKAPDFLSNADPQVFPRHLHFMAGASWKDAKGIHFDQWLE